MHTVTLVLAAIVALEHVYFLYLEMFAWTQPRTRKAFGTTAEFAEASKGLAANQGLYNGFLAAGLVWGMFPGPAQPTVLFFFAGCVVIAAIYGGATVKRSILFIQGLPALLLLASQYFFG
ncbi:MAG: putative rane protein [Candidatus Eremiobacteraeota bacterium]|jgi:putative membrane protein|nr:putative rane protein [Candidatus Eremiobacteraeota bacterium]